MSKPVSQRRYPHERAHKLPAGGQKLVERARREAREVGVAFDNDEYMLVNDPEEGMVIGTLYGTD